MNLPSAENIICECIGGSHLYGLNTAKSDIDIRGIYRLDNFAQIAGLQCGKAYHVECKNDLNDIEFKEFRNAMTLLQNGNIQIIELLFNQKWEKVSALWTEVMENKQDLISLNTLFKSLLGYAQGEVRLANGERTGKLGSKRKEAIDRYGFSPKNFTNLFRLLIAGTSFFCTGNYLVDFTNTEYFDYLYRVKNHPEQFTKEELNNKYHILEQIMKEAFAKTTVRYKFKETAANHFIYLVYKSIFNDYLSPYKQYESAN